MFFFELSYLSTHAECEEIKKNICLIDERNFVEWICIEICDSEKYGKKEECLPERWEIYEKPDGPESECNDDSLKNRENICRVFSEDYLRNKKEIDDRNENKYFRKWKLRIGEVCRGEFMMWRVFLLDFFYDSWEFQFIFFPENNREKFA